MSNKPVYTTLDRLFARQANMYKTAADGLHSEMPDDPSGDGTVEPTTGDYEKQTERDLEDFPFVDITSMDDESAYDDEMKSEIPNMGTDVAEVDDFVVDEYDTDVKDPTGTESPVKVGGYKFASCTFEQNQQMFNKCASALIAYWQGENQTIKQASYGNPAINSGNLEKRAADYLTIVNEAYRDADLFCKNAAYANIKLAEDGGASDDDAPIDVDGESVATMEDTLDDVTPDEAASLADIPEDVLEDLLDSSDVELQLFEEVAEAVNNGQLEPEAGAAILTGELGDDEGGSDDSGSDEEMEKESAWHRYAMMKIAEETPVTEEDVANAAEISPEDAVALEELPPEALEELIAVADDVNAGEIDPELALAVAEGDPEVIEALEEAAGGDAAPVEEEIAAVPPTEEEAEAALSDAAASMDIAPEDMEAQAEMTGDTEKAAKLKLAAYRTRAFRMKTASRKRPAQRKTARAIALRNRFQNVLAELMN